MASCKIKYKGKEYTKEELRRVLTGTTEQDYENLNSGPNTHADLFANTAVPEIKVGYYEGIIEKTMDSISRYEDRKRKLEQERNRKDIGPSEIKKINAERRKIINILEGIPGVEKGLKEELRELQNPVRANIDSIGYYIERDLERLEILADSDNMNDLIEARHLISFYKRAGIFSRDMENPFFLEEEIFDGPNIILPQEVIDQFTKWAARAAKSEEKVNWKHKEIFVKAINNNHDVKKTYGNPNFSFAELVNSEKGLSDINIIDAMVMDITKNIFSPSHIIPQTVYSYLDSIISDKSAISIDIDSRIDAITPKVIDELVKINQTARKKGILGKNTPVFDIFFEKTSNKHDTRSVIRKFTRNFFTTKSEKKHKFDNDLKNASFIKDHSARERAERKAFSEFRQWKRQNTIVIEIDKVPEIISDPEFKKYSTGVSDKEAQDYKNYLISIIGQKEYDSQIAEQKRLLIKYEMSKDDYIETLKERENVEREEDLSQLSKNRIEYWDKQNNPLRGAKEIVEIMPLRDSNGNKIPDNFHNFNVFIPRRVKAKVVKGNGNRLNFLDTTEDLGYYNEVYEEFIEPNEILSEYHDLVMEALDIIHTHLPYDERNRLPVNTFPAIEKSVSEAMMSGSGFMFKLASIFEALAKMFEKMRLQFRVTQQSNMSYKKQDPLTGKMNYKVNSSFLQVNKDLIETNRTLLESRFIASIGGAFPLSRVKKFTRVYLDDLPKESLYFIASIANLNVSSSEIESGDLTKFKERFGESVPIGRLLIDAATHEIVQDQSADLSKIIKYSVNMTMLYSARTEALPLINIMKEYYESIKAPETNNLNEPMLKNVREFTSMLSKIKGKGKGDKDKVVMKGYRNRAIKRFNNWFDRVVLDNYERKHVFVHGFDNRHSLFSKKIYTRKEKKLLIKIEEMLEQEKNPERRAKLEMMAERLGGLRTGTAIMEIFLRWVRFMFLGYNIKSGITNLSEGYASNIQLAAKGEDFPEEYIYEAYGIIQGSFLKNLSFGLVSTPGARKARILMDRYRFLVDSKNILQKSSVKTYSNRFEWLSSYAINQRVEYINQAVLMIAIMKDITIRGNGVVGNLWDALDNKGNLKPEFRTEENIQNWEKNKGSLYQDFNSRVKNAILKGHGNYSDKLGMQIKSNILGAGFMMHKTWITQQLYWRFAHEQDDIASGTKGFIGAYWGHNISSGLLFGTVAGLTSGMGMVIGGIAGLGLGIYNMSKGRTSRVGLINETLTTIYVLVKKLLGMPINTLLRKKIIDTTGKEIDNWVSEGGFTQQHANALKAAITDLAVQLALLASYMILKSLRWDEDEDEDEEGGIWSSWKRRTYFTMANRLMQMSEQASMYQNPLRILETMTTENSIIIYLNNLKTFMKGIYETLYGFGTPSTGPNKGIPKIETGFKRAFIPSVFREKAFISDILDGQIPTLGYGPETKRQFKSHGIDIFLMSDSELDKKRNRSDRAKMRYELIEEQKMDPKEAQKIIDLYLPTPNRLQKLGLTREEYQQWLEDNGYVE